MSVWQYTTGSPGYGMDVIDPQSNETDYSFTPLDDTTSPYENEVQYYQGSGSSKSLKKTVTIAWQDQKAPLGVNGAEAIAYAVPLSWTTTWAAGAVSKRTRTWDNGFTYQIGSYLYDGIFGQDMADIFYDFGSGAPGALLRTVSRGYLDDYTQGLLDPVRVLTVADGTGHTVSQTNNIYDGSSLQYAGAWPGRDSAYQSGSGITARGNLTSQTRYGGSSSNVTLHWTYDAAGNRLTATSGNGNVTTYTFDTSDGAYLTQIAGPPTTTGNKTNTHTEDLTFDTDSGLLTKAEDVENAETTTYAYDSADRPSQINYPDGGETKFGYSGASQVETSRLFDTSNDWAESYTVLDSLGRPERQLSYYPLLAGYCSGDDWQETDTAYDGLNQPIYRSLPYCSSGIGATSATSASQQPGNTFAYDALGREVSDAQPPAVQGQNPEITFSYVTSGTAATTTRTDAAGHQRAWLRDALGRLTAVHGYYASGQYYTTTYGYNALNELTSVAQGSQTRTFAYNELGQLLSATNPESGTTQYSYDLDGNPVKVSEANGTVVTATFDPLDRMRTRSYTVSGSTAATGETFFDYDTDSTGETVYGADGHLTRVYQTGSPVVLSLNQYDPMGRMQVVDTIINGTTYHTSMDFDYLGFPVWQRLASGRKLYLTDDYMARTKFIEDTSGTKYLHARYYGPGGMPYDEDLGNGVSQSWHWNNRDQLVQVDAHPTGNYNMNTFQMDVDFGYTDSAQSMDNGNMLTLTDELGSPGQNYTIKYDGLNRITGWSSGGGVSCNYELDPYGNLVAASGGGCPLLSTSISTSTNQILGDTFDANGNFLSDNVDTTTQFNGNNLLVGYNAPGEQASYIYDGLGDRVEKTVDGATTYYFRNALGQVTSELQGSTWTDFVTTAEGDRVVALTGSNQYYLHYGPLGTLRAITNSSGNNLLNCGQNSSYPEGSMLTYAPFGKETGGCGQSTIAFKFVGYERDSGSGWDNAQARMYAPNIARFLSPDPAGLAAANPANPQTWDGYAYVGNSPLGFVDPFGLQCRPTVQLHNPNNSKNDEASGDFGPYEPQGDSEAGEQQAGPPGYSGCAGGGEQSVMIDGVLMPGGLGMGMEGVGGGPLGGGSPSVLASYVCAYSDCQGASSQINQWGNLENYVYMPPSKCTFGTNSGQCTFSVFSGYNGPQVSPAISGGCSWFDLPCQFFVGFTNAFVFNKPSGLARLGYAESVGVAIGGGAEAYSWANNIFVPTAVEYGRELLSNPYALAAVGNCAVGLSLNGPPLTPVGLACHGIRDGLGKLGISW